MKIAVIARHERDDRDLELDAEQINSLESELRSTMMFFWDIGIRKFTTEDGWSYTLQIVNI